MKEAVRLEDVQQINGLTIKRRVGPAVKAQRLPQYTVWTYDGKNLEEFRRLASAQAWARSQMGWLKQRTEGKMRYFVERIANWQDESETKGGLSWDDLCPTVNALIAEARELTGINPEHPKVFCVACQTPSDVCDCGTPVEELERRRRT